MKDLASKFYEKEGIDSSWLTSWLSNSNWLKKPIPDSYSYSGNLDDDDPVCTIQYTIQCVPIYTEPYKQMVKITNPQQIMMIKMENNSFIEKKREESEKYFFRNIIKQK